MDRIAAICALFLIFTYYQPLDDGETFATIVYKNLANYNCPVPIVTELEAIELMEDNDGS